MISHLPGIRLPARNASTYKETFLLFITEEILQIIVDKTNEYIQTVRDKFRGERGKMILSGEMIPLNDDRMVSAI
jgi:hypothetical protein